MSSRRRIPPDSDAARLPSRLALVLRTGVARTTPTAVGESTDSSYSKLDADALRVLLQSFGKAGEYHTFHEMCLAIQRMCILNKEHASICDPKQETTWKEVFCSVFRLDEDKYAPPASKAGNPPRRRGPLAGALSWRKAWEEMCGLMQRLSNLKYIDREGWQQLDMGLFNDLWSFNIQLGALPFNKSETVVKTALRDLADCQLMNHEHADYKIRFKNVFVNARTGFDASDVMRWWMEELGGLADRARWAMNVRAELFTSVFPGGANRILDMLRIHNVGNDGTVFELKDAVRHNGEIVSKYEEDGKLLDWYVRTVMNQDHPFELSEHLQMLDYLIDEKQQNVNVKAKNKWTNQPYESYMPTIMTDFWLLNIKKVDDQAWYVDNSVPSGLRLQFVPQIRPWEERAPIDAYRGLWSNGKWSKASVNAFLSYFKRKGADLVMRSKTGKIEEDLTNGVP